MLKVGISWKVSVIVRKVEWHCNGGRLDGVIGKLLVGWRGRKDGLEGWLGGNGEHCCHWLLQVGISIRRLLNRISGCCKIGLRCKQFSFFRSRAYPFMELARLQG